MAPVLLVPGLPEVDREYVDELRGCIDGLLASGGRDGLADGIIVADCVITQCYDWLPYSAGCRWLVEVCCGRHANSTNTRNN